MITFLELLLVGGVILSVMIENIYLLNVLIFGISIYSLYESIKNIVYMESSKRKISSKMNLYCKELGVTGNLLTFFIILINIDYHIKIKYILENFSKVSFSEQLQFVINIYGILWISGILIVFIYFKISLREGIIYKEGLILDKSKLYSFYSTKSYEFKTSVKGIKYRDLVLTYDDKVVKTLRIYKDDVDKFKDLLDKNKAI
ncbi:hypothetical protein [Faecalimicrobium sp. JNUCC 81]